MEEPTLICLIGAIGSGKTTILQRLQQLGEPRVDVVSIDDFRRQFATYQPFLEYGAWKACRDRIRGFGGANTVVLECSGTGNYFDEIVSTFPGGVYIVRLCCELEDIYHRIRQRYENGYKWPPVSWSTDPYRVAKRQFDLLEVMPADLVLDTGRETIETCVQSVIDFIALANQ